MNFALANGTQREATAVVALSCLFARVEQNYSVSGLIDDIPAIKDTPWIDVKTLKHPRQTKIM